MKPKFLEVIRLGVLLAAICIAMGVVMHSYEDCQEAVERFGYSLRGPGVEGPLGWIWGWFTWFTYLFFIGCVALVMVIVLHVLGVFTTLAGKLAQGVLWLRNSWAPPPLPLDTVIDTSSSGKPITLGATLKFYNAEIGRLKELTRGLTPPPPPKTAEELVAEKEAEIARLKEQLLRKAAAPVPAVVEAKV